jgi:hypothetical protein
MQQTPIPTRLLKAIIQDPDLLDLAVLGGRIDADIAEYANEFCVSTRTVHRAISKALALGN